MLTWKNNFAPREDGRCTGTLSAVMQRLRDVVPALAFTEECYKSPEAFAQWKEKLIQQLKVRLQMPPVSSEPPPRLVSRSPRDGYTLERWEFYPDRYSAVPVLILRPDNIVSPVPGVLCLPGSAAPKELLAGEPMPEIATMRNYKFNDRNCQALHCVRNGFIAVAFDNPGTGETAELTDDNVDTQGATRSKLVQGCINSGMNYLGLSVFQKLRFLEHFKTMTGVDRSRLAIIGHSLGSEAAICTALLDDDIKALVFNDFLCDFRRRFLAITELNNNEINDSGSIHFVPGLWLDFAFQDLLAAFAPNFLAINEGGAEEYLNIVRKSYQHNNATDRLMITYYPKFADHEKCCNNVPLYGLSFDEYYIDYSAVDVPDHSFRADVSMKLLNKAFTLQK